MTRIVAHRGLHRPHFDAAENSLSSMQAAWGCGIARCECDIRFSRDDLAMVIHDAAIERPGQQVNIAQFSATELSELGVPLLGDVLAAMPADCGLLIEPKTRTHAKFLDWLRALRVSGQIALHTFELDDLPAMVAAGFSTAAIVDQARMIDRAITSPASGVHLDQKLLDPDLMARIRHAGKSVGVWTVNDPAAIDKFVGLGVDYLITDDPVGAAARNR